jgi:hypothetical protein
MSKNLKGRVAIPLNKRKLVVLVLAALGFVVVGVMVWLLADAIPGLGSLLIKGAAVLVVGFCGLCGAYGLLKLFDTAPGLVLDQQGIIDNSSAVAAGRIRWDEITEIRFSTLEGQQFLTVQVANPKRFVEMGGFFRRMLNRANTWLVGSSINISASSLRISFDELTKQISEFYRVYGRDA